MRYADDTFLYAIPWMNYYRWRYLAFDWNSSCSTTSSSSKGATRFSCLFYARTTHAEMQMLIDASEKRVLSQPISSITARRGALRIGGKLARISKSAFMTPVRSATDMHVLVGSASMEELQAVDSFPINLSESVSRAAGHLVSGGKFGIDRIDSWHPRRSRTDFSDRTIIFSCTSCTYQ